MLKCAFSICLTLKISNDTLWGVRFLQYKCISKRLHLGKIIMKSRFQFWEYVYNELEEVKEC